MMGSIGLRLALPLSKSPSRKPELNTPLSLEQKTISDLQSRRGRSASVDILATTSPNGEIIALFPLLKIPGRLIARSPRRQELASGVGGCRTQWEQPPCICHGSGNFMNPSAFVTGPQQQEAYMSTTSRGRAQDRARVAGSQDYEVRYEADKEGVSKDDVKESIKEVGNSRDKIEADLEKGT
jgi:hypothetical protein